MPLVKKTSVTAAQNESTTDADLGVIGAAVTTDDRIVMDAAERCLAVQQNISHSAKEAHFIELVKIADTSVVKGLMPLLRSEDAWLRNKAIEALREMPDAVAPHMNGLLQDSDSDVRIFAINVLETLRHRDVERWLIATVEDDDHPNVIGAALDLLAEVGSAACLDVLHGVAVRFAHEPYLQFAARTALKRIEASVDV